MSCHDFEADLVDLARGAEFDTPAAAGVREHIATCPVCAARFERERRLTAGLKDLADCGPRPERSAAMEQKLLEAFAARQTAAPERPPRGVFAATTSRRWLAAAAVLVLAVSGWLGYTRWRAADLRAAVVPAAGPGLTDEGRGGEPLEFIALPTAVGLPTLESGRIVRLDVPMGVLPAYGLEVAPDDMGRVVQADVLVGQDGQPRGIRFVNPAPETDSEPGRRP